MGWTVARFQREMRKFDKLLRVRLANDGASYLIERKAKHESPCLVRPRDNQRIDDYIRNRDGYVYVARVSRGQLNHQVLMDLRAHDMWTFRGAGYYADWLEAQEKKEQERIEREQSDKIQCLAEEGYDKQMIKQGDVVSGFHSKVGGWEP